jgi:SOS response associated peptidase (SRAP)
MLPRSIPTLSISPTAIDTPWLNWKMIAKAPLLARFLQDRGFTTLTYPGHWQAYVTGQGREANRPDLAELERRYLYRFVLSCVDDNGARHALQNLWPDMLIGGSTTIAPIHDRMPVLFTHSAEWDAWLDPEAVPKELQKMLAPAPDGLLEVNAVSRDLLRIKEPAAAILSPIVLQPSGDAHSYE